MTVDKESQARTRPIVVAGVTELLIWLDVDPNASEHIERTPERFVAMMKEMLEPIEFIFTTFPNDEGIDEIILVRDIAFYSLCEHHMVPFFGVAHVAYIPTKQIAGLSKLPRLVEASAKGLNTQERITQRIANGLWANLSVPNKEPPSRLDKAVFTNILTEPLGTACIMEARHLCMEMRGVKASGASTTTSAMRGVFLDKTNQARQELLRLVYADR